jgi:ATP-dependent DNA helicase RecG
MLMFGREEVLRKTVPQYSVDYREKLSEDPYIRWTDRVMIDGTWPGNLFQFYVKVVQKLFSDLKVPFQLDGELFRKGETVVHEAVREALVNSLIHTDYLGQGGIVIEKYRDRFEFSNPGMLLITMDQLLGGNVSECRNRSLQTMFTMIGAAEKAGSGIDKILKGWGSQHWRQPIVRERVRPDRILWTLPMISLLPEESLARLRQRFGGYFQKFSPMEIQVLVTADVEGFVDNARMRQMTSEHSADVTKVLQVLVSKGVLVQDGQGRWTRYCLAAPLIFRESSPLHKEGSSVHLGPSSVHLGPSSVHLDGLSELELDEISRIAEVAKRKKQMTYSDMEAILVKLCQKRWLTKKQLAVLLQRNQDALRIRFLSPMVERNLLSLRYPETPNHMNQAYTSNVNNSEEQT